MIHLLLQPIQADMTFGLVFVVGLILLMAFVSIHTTIEEEEDLKIYNHGKCSCGGNWYISGERYIRHTVYTYSCDKCDKWFNSSFYFNKDSKSPTTEAIDSMFDGFIRLVGGNPEKIREEQRLKEEAKEKIVIVEENPQIKERTKKDWNGRTHTDCGGKFRYKTTKKNSKDGLTYDIYCCDKCKMKMAKSGSLVYTKWESLKESKG